MSLKSDGILRAAQFTRAKKIKEEKYRLRSSLGDIRTAGEAKSGRQRNPTRPPSPLYFLSSNLVHLNVGFKQESHFSTAGHVREGPRPRALKSTRPIIIRLGRIKNANGYLDGAVA